MRKLINRLSREERGFTLIELLVVVAIIGILAAVAFPKISGAIAQARDKKAKGDLAVIESALDRFHNDHGFYPPSLQDLTKPQHGDAYLKRDFDFRNAYSRLYFYAVRYDGAGQTVNFSEYVLADPGKNPALNAGNWNTSGPFPEGSAITTAYAFGNATNGGGQAWNTSITVAPADYPTDENNQSWTVNGLIATGQTSKSTRTDVKTN